LRQNETTSWAEIALPIAPTWGIIAPLKYSNLALPPPISCDNFLYSIMTLREFALFRAILNYQRKYYFKRRFGGGKKKENIFETTRRGRRMLETTE